VCAMQPGRRAGGPDDGAVRYGQCFQRRETWLDPKKTRMLTKGGARVRDPLAEPTGSRDASAARAHLRRGFVAQAGVLKALAGCGGTRSEAGERYVGCDNRHRRIHPGLLSAGIATTHSAQRWARASL
jgi:hypothetical protein